MVAMDITIANPLSSWRKGFENGTLTSNLHQHLDSLHYLIISPYGKG